MSFSKKFINSILFGMSVIGITQYANATDGYFSEGYGVKSQSMGGVGIALPQDALAAASNPAGMALIGDRIDIGLTWFRPEREATLSNTGGGFSDGTFNGNVAGTIFSSPKQD